jgi:Domain of unknown function (DUF4258)
MKSKNTRPIKIHNLLELINDCIESGRYRSCLHLEQRERERNITRREVLYVLKHGFHEKKEDDYDEQYQTWNYAIRGKTVDQRDLRIFVSFDEKTMMIIITTFEIGK